MDFRIKTITCEGKTVKLQIWDPFCRFFEHVTDTRHFRSAHGLLVMFDITNMESFRALRKILEDARIYTDNTCQMVIVGTKRYLIEQRKVGEQEAKEFSEALGLQ